MNTARRDPSVPRKSHWWFVCLMMGVAFTAIGLSVWPTLPGAVQWNYEWYGQGRTNLDTRDVLQLKLANAQSALARYEAEHREWSTETIAKMKKFLDDMRVEVAGVAKQDGAKAVATFLEGRKSELENMAVEMKERLAKIEAKSAEVEALRKQLGETEDKRGVMPSAME